MNRDWWAIGISVFSMVITGFNIWLDRKIRKIQRNGAGS